MCIRKEVILLDYRQFKELDELPESSKTEILKLLNEKPMTVQQIAEKLDLNRSTIYHHLRNMKDKIIPKRFGKYVYWGLKSKVEEDEI